MSPVTMSPVARRQAAAIQQELRLAQLACGSFVMVRKGARGRLAQVIYLGPVPYGIKFRFARHNARLGRWVGYTAHSSHLATIL